MQKDRLFIFLPSDRYETKNAHAENRQSVSAKIKG